MPLGNRIDPSGAKPQAQPAKEQTIGIILEIVERKDMVNLDPRVGTKKYQEEVLWV